MSEDNDDVFNGYGIEVTLKKDFNKVREALTRVGIANHRTKHLTQSCHIFHKRGRYAIMHFLEMFLFDEKTAEFTEVDEARRNRIALMLEEWGLVEIIDKIDKENDPVANPSSFAVISRKKVQDEKWTLDKKYTLGKH